VKTKTFTSAFEQYHEKKETVKPPVAAANAEGGIIPSLVKKSALCY